jgi:uncharacterized protein YgiM (DUF1202 family)
VTGPWKWIRAIAGVAVVLALALVVNSWFREFRQASDSASTASVSATSSVGASGSAGATQTAGKPSEASPADQMAAGTTAVVQVNGVVLRRDASGSSPSVRTLTKGERLFVVSTTAGWVQVKDLNGKVGWVAANPQLVKTEK